MQINGASYYPYLKQDYTNTSSTANLNENAEKNSAENSSETSKNENSKEKNINELSPSERSEVRQLQVIDTKVRAHEMAHMAAGAGLTGGASYTYTRGPDNKMYATAGEVPISVPHSNDPQENLTNARRVQTAALAPSDPSPQDYRVAAAGMRMELEARAELVKIKAEENKETEEKNEAKEAEAANSSEGGTTDEVARAKREQIIASYTSKPQSSSFIDTAA